MFSVDVRNRSWRRLRRTATALAVAAIVTVGGSVVAAPAQAASSGSPCDYGVVISARGTSAPAGDGSIHGGRVYASGGWNGGLASIKELLISYSPMPLQFLALRYPAGGATYGPSVSQGVDTLVQEINWISEQCGAYTPAIFLLGYSQGADVVSRAAISNGLTARGKGAIAGVASIANPNFQPFKPFDAPGSASGGSGRFGGYTPSMNDALASMRFWGFPPPGGSQGWVYRVRAWCQDGDYWCSSGDGPNAGTIHDNAANTYATSVKDWIQYIATEASGF
ncbi:cutinase family protein [Microbacterium sp. BH-3-3-3]|uniref:cutinase family protein n=1 Tax=Microbacterium sp. BH-3-3-3 TaxID=1906742 RepID=UPI0011A7E6ED|nr:cutinase family protein [Microbacterium sp. BH-3-3-3]